MNERSDYRSYDAILSNCNVSLKITFPTTNEIRDLVAKETMGCVGRKVKH